MKKNLFLLIMAVILAAVLYFGVSTISKDYTPAPDFDEEEEKTAVEIKYPQFMSKVIENSPVYIASVQQENAVIRVHSDDINEVVTSKTSVTNFLEDIARGEPTELLVVDFYISDGYTGSISLAKGIFDGENYYTHRRYSRRRENIYKVSARNIAWVSEEKQRDGFSLVNDVMLKVEDDDEAEPIYTQVINYRDVYEDYDINNENSEKYISPIYLQIVNKDYFNSADEIEDFYYIFERIAEIEGIEKEKLYNADGSVPFDVIYRAVSRYFEADEETVYAALKKYDKGGKNILCEGGLGGAYPKIIILEKDISGDILTLKAVTASVFDGSLGEPVLIKIKLEDGGAFKYISLSESN